jgi:hypothetical protein
MIDDLQTCLPLPPLGTIPLGEAVAMTATPRLEKILHTRRKKRLVPHRPSATMTSLWPQIVMAEKGNRLGAVSKVADTTDPRAIYIP